MLRARRLSLVLILIVFSSQWIAHSGLAAEKKIFISNSGNPLITRLTGLTCDVWDDPQGIAHLRAEQEIEGIACLGFIHARDRSWQMDFFRRIAQGRKAEILGKEAIRSDFFLKLLGLNEKAQTLFQGMNPKEQEILWAYSYGINRGMEYALKNQLPGTYEFDQLSYLPEPWRPVDTLQLILLESFEQTRRSFQIQLEEQNRQIPKPFLISETSTDSASEKLLGQKEFSWDKTILKPGEYPQAKTSYPRKATQVTQTLSESGIRELISFAPGLWDVPGSGSNNWVMGQSRSRSGKAWLANDPHLKLGHPPFWHWSHLTVRGKGTRSKPELDWIGSYFPGVPFVATGTNSKVSWGLTNSFMPVAKVAFVSEKTLTGVTETRPWIWVRFWKFQLPFFFKTYKRTQEGLPILPLPGPDGSAPVLYWTGFDLTPNDLMGFYRLIRAKTVKEVDQELSRANVPSWNFVFADTSGGIGFRTVGRVPRFPGSMSRKGSDHWTEAELKEAFARPLLPEEMPHLLNPKRDYIVTANNRQWPDDASWSGGWAQLPGFRAFRIEELIQQDSRHDLKSMQKIQCDIQAVDARFFLPYLLKWMDPTGRFDEASTRGKLNARGRRAIQLLKAWNYQTDLHCLPCGLYRRWMDHLLNATKLTVRELYGILAYPDVKTAGDRVDLPKDSKIASQVASPIHSQMDSQDQRSFSDWIWLAFQDALQDVQLREDALPQEWGKIHLSFFEHLAVESGRFPRTETQDALPTPGDEYSVNLGSAEWNGKLLNNLSGPSQRVVIEMSNPPQVYSVLAGPNLDIQDVKLNSPGSPWEKWVNCQQDRQIFPLSWNKILGKTQKIRL